MLQEGEVVKKRSRVDLEMSFVSSERPARAEQEAGALGRTIQNPPSSSWPPPGHLRGATLRSACPVVRGFGPWYRRWAENLKTRKESKKQARERRQGPTGKV